MEESAVVDHLVARRLAAPDARIAVRPLPGGVSGEVSAVAGPGLDVVVKRPSARLRVEDDWFADEERVVTEGWALRLATDLVPATAPPVVDLDPLTRTLVLQHAPAGWRNWRTELLEGRVDPAVGAELGRVLAAWHLRSAEHPRLLASFEDRTAFVQLRIDPFHRRVAERHPDLAGEIGAVVDRLLGRGACLVHGDFSPKNVLVGPDGQWVLDWEVAHVGDPGFDLAYMLCHLTLKSVHRPRHAPRYRETARRFLDSYGASRSDELAAGVGCLLLARVDGKSPADYLTADGRERVRALGREALRDPRSLWEAT